MKRLASFLVAVAACSSAWASEPGQPLDCSDWVFLEPGLTCTTLIPYPCDLDGPGGDIFSDNCLRLGGASLDNTGRTFFIKHSSLGPACGVGSSGLGLNRWELLFINDDGSESVFAHLDDRCNGTTSTDYISSCVAGFDPVRGVLNVGCLNGSAAIPATNETYTAAPQRMQISGFATLFEILQTYTPTADALGFRVPYMPEGFQYADYFDTYYGDLATVGDWSHAQPLQCEYPATPTSVGDYLTVADTLPNPAPGTGRYYVTAVTHQGQRRYGRKATNGVLSGRDPAVLPGCE